MKLLKKKLTPVNDPDLRCVMYRVKGGTEAEQHRFIFLEEEEVTKHCLEKDLNSKSIYKILRQHNLRGEYNVVHTIETAQDDDRVCEMPPNIRTIASLWKAQKKQRDKIARLKAEEETSAEIKHTAPEREVKEQMFIVRMSNGHPPTILKLKSCSIEGDLILAEKES